jgi:membrane fusion protein (multidrug efflux system)
MKFIPRQPKSRPGPIVPIATTRHLRLQPEETEKNAAAGTPPTARLPESRRPRPETSSLPSGATASQRVRLRLDPEVATQPLPPALRPAYPAPSLEPAVEPEAASSSGWAEPETVPPPTEEVPDAQSITTAPEERAESVMPAPEAAVEKPAPAAEIGHQIPAAATEAPTASQATAAWPQASRRLTPPEQIASLRVRTGALSPISLSRMARGERPATRRRFSPRGPEKEETAPLVLPPTSPPAATDSRPLPRPELRRPSATQLAEHSRPDPSLGRGFWILLILVLLLIGGVVYFFRVIPQVTGFLVARVHPPAPAERAVVYTVARRIMTPVELSLSGTIEPFQQTALYARTTGYVRDWLADIGDPVKAGQVLAELDTPDVDHQLTEARATADSAKARLTLAQDEAKRWDAMAAAHAVSQQDADEKDSARDEAQASFNAAQASVARLVDMEIFKEIRAPYAGRITSRNLEVGTLVAAGPGATGSELFNIAQTDPVRVFVEVPEANAPAVQPGLVAHIEVSSFPDRIFNGTVVRDAGILDNTSHTLRTELRVANPDGALLPGARAGVLLELGNSAPVVLVPANTLVTRGAGVSVVRLTQTGGHDVAHFTPVKVGRDFGAEVEVLDNVQEGDRLVSHPPTDLQDGTAVNARPLEESPIPSLLPPKPSAPRA